MKILGTGFDVRVVTGMETTVWEVTRGVEINADAVQLSDRRTNTMRYNTTHRADINLRSAQGSEITTHDDARV